MPPRAPKPPAPPLVPPAAANDMEVAPLAPGIDTKTLPVAPPKDGPPNVVAAGDDLAPPPERIPKGDEAAGAPPPAGTGEPKAGAPKEGVPKEGVPKDEFPRAAAGVNPLEADDVHAPPALEEEEEDEEEDEVVVLVEAKAAGGGAENSGGPSPSRTLARFTPAALSLPPNASPEAPVGAPPKPSSPVKLNGLGLFASIRPPLAGFCRVSVKSFKKFVGALAILFDSF